MDSVDKLIVTFMSVKFVSNDILLTDKISSVIFYLYFGFLIVGNTILFCIITTFGQPNNPSCLRKSKLLAMPSFFLSVSKMLQGVRKNIIKIHIDFLWS